MHKGTQQLTCLGIIQDGRLERPPKQSHKRLRGDFGSRLPLFSKVGYWQCSSNLISGWCPKRIEARAVSIILFRNEDHHTALSTRSILELANNETKYFDDNYLQSLVGAHAVVRNLLPSSVHFISRNPSCYWKEVLRTIRLNSEAKSTSHLVPLKDILPSCWVWWYDCSSALLLHWGPFESGPWNNIVSKTYVSGYHSEMLHNRPSL